MLQGCYLHDGAFRPGQGMGLLTSLSSVYYLAYSGIFTKKMRFASEFSGCLEILQASGVEGNSRKKKQHVQRHEGIWECGEFKTLGPAVCCQSREWKAERNSIFRLENTDQLMGRKCSKTLLPTPLHSHKKYTKSTLSQ